MSAALFFGVVAFIALAYWAGRQLAVVFCARRPVARWSAVMAGLVLVLAAGFIAAVQFPSHLLVFVWAVVTFASFVRRMWEFTGPQSNRRCV